MRKKRHKQDSKSLPKPRAKKPKSGSRLPTGADRALELSPPTRSMGGRTVYAVDYNDADRHVSSSHTGFIRCLKLDLPVKPVPKALVVARGRLMPTTSSRAYMEYIRAESAKAVADVGTWNPDGPFKVHIAVKVKSLAKGDLDNFCKAILDGLQPHAFANDADVHHIELEKSVGKPGAVVRITNMGDPDAPRKERKPHASTKKKASRSKSGNNAILRRRKRFLAGFAPNEAGAAWERYLKAAGRGSE